ncbi:hypothetical protein LguiA_020131 [Lonicera macranthoides]
MSTSSSPFPLNLLSLTSTYSSSSPSLYFLSPLSKKKNSANTFKALNFKVYCYNQIETQQQLNPTKKKRKPRPSFLDQIQDKWSVKTTSQREKFPWQEQEEAKIEPIQEEEKYQREEKMVNFGSNNRVILAPWVQKNKPIKTQFDFEARDSQKLKTVSVSSSSVQEKKDLERGLNYEGGISKVVETPIELPIKSSSVDQELYNVEDLSDEFDFEVRVSQNMKTVSSSSVQEKKKLERGLNYEGRISKIDETPFESPIKSSSIDQEIYNVEGLSDEFDSTKLPRESKSYLKSEKGQEMYSVEDLSDEFDSMKLQVEKNSDLNYVEEDKFRERLPWEKGSEMKSDEKERFKAEKLIPEFELKRLRNVALRMLERIKVGAAGITEGLVRSIHEKWKESEVVKLKFEGPSAMNMRRNHEILESRTGGLVIWRSGGSVVLFRGMTYKLQCVQSYTKQTQSNTETSQSSKDLANDSMRPLKDLSEEELTDLSELNRLLDELGPRFKDWAGREPLPVDADLLPPVVRGYRRPFRLLPYGTRKNLRDKEMTYFRRSAKTMPPHFALGRNRELEGLATAMVKLWERSAIAKIAIKRGVHNTRNERMAEELKRLTGGTLVSRNKEYIVFYRGNDFLPPGVTNKLVEAKDKAALLQDMEDQARQIASTLIDSNVKTDDGPLVAGTLAETLAATSRWANQPSSEERDEMMRERALARHASLVRYLEKKLALANGKVKRAEKALRKVQEKLEPAQLPTDLETLTDEERFLFRKIGLSMKPFLLLGRRGIFDGTVENMHLHWKYRELVKIIVDGKRFAQVKHIAISLEAESGGVLVSLDKTTKGYAIIIYRGKNYERPRAIRPKNLLTRRQALARSIELQRREALKHHVSELQERMEKLKSELEEMKTVKEIDEATLYSRIDNASDGDDDYVDNEYGDITMEEDEEEEEEAYLETYDSGNEDGDN